MQQLSTSDPDDLQLTLLPDLSPDDVFYVFTTTGTTGYSKLVSRTHRWFFRCAGQKQEVVAGVEPPRKYIDHHLGMWLRGVQFAIQSKFGQIGPKWDKSETF